MAPVLNAGYRQLLGAAIGDDNPWREENLGGQMCWTCWLKSSQAAGTACLTATTCVRGPVGRQKRGRSREGRRRVLTGTT